MLSRSQKLAADRQIRCLTAGSGDPAGANIESAEVIVTFVPFETKGVDLRARGLTVEQVIELRQRLLTFEEDWNAPGMEAYDEL